MSYYSGHPSYTHAYAFQDTNNGQYGTGYSPEYIPQMPTPHYGPWQPPPLGFERPHPSEANYPLGFRPNIVAQGSAYQNPVGRINAAVEPAQGPLPSSTGSSQRSMPNPVGAQSWQDFVEQEMGSLFRDQNGYPF